MATVVFSPYVRIDLLLSRKYNYSMAEYSVTDIAKKLKVSTRTIQREIRRGKLVANRVGRKFLISDVALERYFQKDALELEEKVTKFCQSKKYDMVNLLQRLVAMPSEADIPESQENLAKFLKATLENMGLRTVMYGEGESSTVHATFGYAKKGLLFDCPLDTVPVGDPDRWSYPPHDGLIKNGKMYGRGTADCKAGIVAMIYSVLALREYVDEHKVRVELVFDGGEQNGQYVGMQSTLDRGIDVEAGIVGYAGNAHELAIGSRGYHRYKFRVKGKAAHTGSRTHYGINAITKAAALIRELDMITFPKSKYDLFWFGSRITPAIIEGGNAINVVPDECVIDIDTRIPPDLSRKQVDAKINEVIKKLKKQDPEFSVTMTYGAGNEGYVIKKTDKIIGTVLNAIQTTINIKPELIVNGQAHVGNLLAKYKIPVIVKGPVGGNVHSYDEYVAIDSLPQTSEIYAKTIVDYFELKK